MTHTTARVTHRRSPRPPRPPRPPRLPYSLHALYPVPPHHRMGGRAAGRMLPQVAALAGLATLMGLAACDATAPIATPTVRIAATGRAERGSTLALELRDGSGAIPGNEVEWVATSSTGRSAMVSTPGQLRLLDTGLVTIIAHGHGKTATITFHVEMPPTIVFDMHDVDSSGNLGNRDVYRMTLDGQALTRLTSGAGDNEEPTVAGGTVIFTSYRDGYPALYRTTIGGAQEARLVGLTGPAYQPALAPDGAHLAFVAPDSGADKVWTAAADGSGARRATVGWGTVDAEEASPTWAPDASGLTFVSTAFGDAGLVALTTATAATPAQLRSLTASGSTTDVEPSWSPDGGSIVFSSTRDGDVALFLYAVATGTVTRLTPAPANAGEPSWVSDTRIVYTQWSYTADGPSSQLVWVDVAHPEVVHPIVTPPGMPEHAQPVR